MNITEKQHNKYIKWYYTDINKSRLYVKEHYNKWIANPKNRLSKKEYQKWWWLNVKKPREQERRRIEKELQQNNSFTKNGYIVYLKRDKGNNYFFYIKKNDKIIYMSEKYVLFEDIKKEMLEAI